jgi:hypothetical protein
MATSPEQSGAGSANAFKAAAERLDRIAQVVKDKQLSDTRSGPRVARPDSFVASPQEAWARQFMTQSIEPAAPRAAFAPLPAYVPLTYPAAARPDSGQAFARTDPSGDSPIRPEAQVERQRGQGHMIGTVLGKPVKRRGWVGRLLLGR